MLYVEYLVARALGLGKSAGHLALALEGFDPFHSLYPALDGKGFFHDLFVAQTPALHFFAYFGESGDLFILTLFCLFQLELQLVPALGKIGVIAGP